MEDQILKPEEEVAESLAYFVGVFNDLKWDEFRSCFADDASVISPFPNSHYRTEGLQELERDWRPIFDERREKLPGPPYLNIDPVDVKMRTIGETTVLVTFHLENLFGSPVLNRRTLVFEKRDQRWLIIHLHASRAVVDK